MSPSESDLRAALQHGDDDGLGVNANTIIAHGQAIRARRVRILSGAAAAVVVAAGAVALAVARGDGGGSNLAGGGGAGDAGAASGSIASGAEHRRAQQVPGAPAATSAPSPAPANGSVPIPGSLDAGRCPDSAPHLLLPGGGSSGQFGSDAALFSKSVDTLVVCVYGTTPATSSGVPGRLTFTGQQATQIVASMENAAAKPNQTPCDPGGSSTSQLLAFIGVTSGGKPLAPVTATVTVPACNVQLTNGTAVRYGWSPPAVLTGELRGLTPPRTVITVPDEPTEHGSPPHS
jgi:hypothetical protein